MSRPLTILHCTHDGRRAGSSVSIALLARAQREAGHHVTVACPPGRWLAALVRGAGGGTAELDFGRISLAARGIAALADGADVVNTHSSRDRAACRRLRFAGRLRAALVMTRRAMPLSSPLSAVASGLAADRIIAVSHAVAAALVRRGTPRGRVAVIHNAVDLERLDRPLKDDEVAEAALLAGVTNRGPWTADGGPSGPAHSPVHGSRSTVPGSRSPVIGCVSRHKDHATLLRALARLPTHVALVCAGTGPDRALRELAAAAAPRHVALLPFVDDPRPLYELFDIVVLPTMAEGLSQGVLEAMALGKPVVTTRTGGNTDLIDDGVHGLLVPRGDPAALAGALNLLIGDPALAARLGSAARVRARTEFTVARTLAGTDAVYRAALARRGLAA